MIIIGILCGVLLGLLVLGVFGRYENESATPRPQIPEPKSFKEIIDAISQPAVVHRRQRYVCGFAFHSVDEVNVRPKVVLIRKVKPDWQKGKLNGVGGKIESGETEREAMCREFHEETGIHISADQWDIFAIMRFPKAEVVFLRTFNEDCKLAKTQTVWSDEVQSMITEPVEHRHVRGIDEIPATGIMPNLRWAVPLAFHTEHRKTVVVEYDEHN